MGDIQKLTIDGKNYVLLSEEDYEDLIDGLQAAEIMGRVAAGEETWPHALVCELMETDSRIRTYRNYRQMSLSDLAEAAGIATAHLSAIEADQQTASIEVLKRIANVLKVDLEDLVVQPVVDQYGASTLPMPT